MIKNSNKITGDSHTPFSLKLQVLLTATLIPCFVLLALNAWGVLVPIGFMVLFMLSAIPLTVRCLSHDKAVGLVAPIFISCRAIGLTLGLAKGVINRLSKLLK